MEFLDIAEDNWFVEVTASDKPVLVFFYVPWNKYCETVEGFIEDIYNEYGDRVKYVRMDMDNTKVMKFTQRINATPTVTVYYKGAPVRGCPGLPPKKVFDSRIKMAIELVERKKNLKKSKNQTQ